MANATDLRMINGIQWYTRGSGKRAYYWLGTKESHQAEVVVRCDDLYGRSGRARATWSIYLHGRRIGRVDDLQKALTDAFMQWKGVA